MDVILPLVERWSMSRSIASLPTYSQEETEMIKAEYLRISGASRCTSCPDWLWDALLYLAINYKQQGLLTTMTTKHLKHIIKGGEGAYLQTLDGGTIYVNEGGNANTTLLTNEISAALLKAHPEYYGELIIENPEYEAPAKKKDEDEGKKTDNK